VPAYDFAIAHKDTLKLNDTVLAEIKENSDDFCGYTAIQRTLSAYPPNGTVASDFELRASGLACKTDRTIKLSAQEANECFSTGELHQNGPCSVGLIVCLSQGLANMPAPIRVPTAAGGLPLRM